MKCPTQPAARGPAGLLLLIALVGLAGCGGGATKQTVIATPVAPEPLTRSSLGDFADPGVLVDGNTLYAYATNAKGQAVQVASSADGVQWKALPDAMPGLASWAQPNRAWVWAPEVIKVGGSYLMYYTARDRMADRQCVGVASSASPAGPFVDRSAKAMVCQLDRGGTIDPSPFRDADGKLYLYFKNDGNCCAQATWLWGQALSPDGLSVQGSATALLRNSLPWEGANIEAPFMGWHGGSYRLFYSGNMFDRPAYAIGTAACDTPLGPCRASPANPILKTQMGLQPPLIGPGGAALFVKDGQEYMAYHAWQVDDKGQQGKQRLLYIDRLQWLNGVPSVQGPTVVP